MYREQLIGPPADQVEQAMQPQGDDPNVIAVVIQALRSNERQEMNQLLQE